MIGDKVNHVSAKLMLHEGGTKFYEVVIINPDPTITGASHVVIRRWGKTEAARRGGETKVELYSSARTAMLNADKLVRSKESGGYTHQNTAAGRLFAKVTGGFNYDKQADMTNLELAETMSMHYKGLTPSPILEALGIIDVYIDPANIDLTNPIIIESPEPEPERGPEWGSF